VMSAVVAAVDQADRADVEVKGQAGDGREVSGEVDRVPRSTGGYEVRVVAAAAVQNSTLVAVIVPNAVTNGAATMPEPVARGSKSSVITAADTEPVSDSDTSAVVIHAFISIARTGRSRINHKPSKVYAQLPESHRINALSRIAVARTATMCQKSRHLRGDDRRAQGAERLSPHVDLSTLEVRCGRDLPHHPNG